MEAEALPLPPSTPSPTPIWCTLSPRCDRRRTRHDIGQNFDWISSYWVLLSPSRILLYFLTIWLLVIPWCFLMSVLHLMAIFKSFPMQHTLDCKLYLTSLCSKHPDVCTFSEDLRTLEYFAQKILLRSDWLHTNRLFYFGCLVKLSTTDW